MPFPPTSYPAASLGARGLDALIRPLPPLQPEWRRAAAVRTFRIATLLAAALFPVFGWVYHATQPGVVDPMWVRGAFSAVMVGVFAASYVSEWVRAHTAALLLASAHGITGWFAALTLVNGFTPAYALGLLFVIVTSGMLCSLSFEGVGPLVRYVLTSLALSACVSLAAVEAPAGERAVFLLCVGGASVALHFLVASGLQAMDLLERQGVRLAEAQRMAGMGSWEWCEATERAEWSGGLYRLLGLDPSRAPLSLPQALRLVHPEDRGAVVALLRAGGTAALETVRVRLPGGGERVLRLAIRPVYARSRAVRYFGTCQDVTAAAEREAALVAAREAAERARAEAETADRVKAHLLTSMSHELRTPLTAIIGFAQVLSEEAPDGGTRSGAEFIERGGRRLLATLGAVLDYAALEAGDLPLRLAPADPAAPLRTALTAVRCEAERKGLSLALDVPDDLPAVLADVSALDRVLGHLVHNAVKFTDVGGVAVRVSAEGERVRFDVEDTGSGICPGLLPHLFEPFRQGSEGLERAHEGSGLGLAVASRLVERMGGLLEVDSTPGAGSTLTVWLPAVAPLEVGGDGAPRLEAAAA